MNDEMMNAIRTKLNPRRFPNMSGKMAAIVGYLLDEAYANPVIVEMCVTSDQMVLARLDGDVGCNQFIGSYADLFRNWRTLITTPGVNLTTEEAAACIDLLTTELDVHTSVARRPPVLTGGGSASTPSNTFIIDANP